MISIKISADRQPSTHPRVTTEAAEHPSILHRALAHPMALPGAAVAVNVAFVAATVYFLEAPLPSGVNVRQALLPFQRGPLSAVLALASAGAAGLIRMTGIGLVRNELGALVLRAGALLCLPWMMVGRVEATPYIGMAAGYLFMGSGNLSSAADWRALSSRDTGQVSGRTRLAQRQREAFAMVRHANEQPGALGEP